MYVVREKTKSTDFYYKTAATHSHGHLQLLYLYKISSTSKVYKFKYRHYEKINMCVFIHEL